MKKAIFSPKDGCFTNIYLTVKNIIMPRKNKSIKHQSYSADSLFCTKRRYRNEKEAIDAAEYQMLKDMNLELTVYKCDLCKYWHLTRNTNKKF